MRTYSRQPANQGRHQQFSTLQPNQTASSNPMLTVQDSPTNQQGSWSRGAMPQSDSESTAGLRSPFTPRRPAADKPKMLVSEDSSVMTSGGSLQTPFSVGSSPSTTQRVRKNHIFYPIYSYMFFF